MKKFKEFIKEGFKIEDDILSYDANQPNSLLVNDKLGKSSKNK